MRPVIFEKKHEFTYLKLKNSCLTWQRMMFSTEISWKFMRDLDLPPATRLLPLDLALAGFCFESSARQMLG